MEVHEHAVNAYLFTNSCTYLQLDAAFNHFVRSKHTTANESLMVDVK